MVRSRAILLGLVLAVAVVLLDSWHPAHAQTGFNVTDDHLEQEFPDVIHFALSLANAGDVETIDLVYSTDGRSCQDATVRQPVDFDAGDQVETSWEWELKRSGTLPPGVLVSWRWEIADSSGVTIATEEQSQRIEDPHHPWREIERDGVIVQWYEGDAGFGDEIMDIAQQSLARLETDLGIRPDSTIRVIVYPGSDELLEALLFPPNWAGGIAFPEYNSTMIGVGPGEHSWAGQVVPHELTHLLAGTLTFNCRGVHLPTWLEEGLAEYVEGALDSFSRAKVVSALEDGSLERLSSLERGFSAYGDDARLSYAQSAMVVEYMVDTFGPDNLVEFLGLIREGRAVDNALLEAFGLDTNGIDAAWRSSLGFEADFGDGGSGEDPAPTPVPTIALVNPGFSPPPSETPAADDPAPAPEAAPTATTMPGPSVEPEEVESTAPAPTPESGDGEGSGWLWFAAPLALLFIGGLVVFLRRRSTESPPA